MMIFWKSKMLKINYIMQLVAFCNFISLTIKYVFNRNIFWWCGGSKFCCVKVKCHPFFEREIFWIFLQKFRNISLLTYHTSSNWWGTPRSPAGMKFRRGICKAKWPMYLLKVKAYQKKPWHVLQTKHSLFVLILVHFYTIWNSNLI